MCHAKVGPPSTVSQLPVRAKVLIRVIIFLFISCVEFFLSFVKLVFGLVDLGLEFPAVVYPVEMLLVLETREIVVDGWFLAVDWKTRQF